MNRFFRHLRNLIPFATKELLFMVFNSVAYGKEAGVTKAIAATWISYGHMIPQISTQNSQVKYQRHQCPVFTRAQVLSFK